MSTTKQRLVRAMYLWLRRLHLYIGLFLCPFLVIFAISTIRLNHGWHAQPVATTETVPLPIPDDLLAAVTDRRVMSDMTDQRKAAVRQSLVEHILAQLNVSGEVAGLGVVRNGRTAINVARPGVVKNIVVDVRAQQATITTRRHGLLGTMRYLHVMPGPHKHPNWIGTKAWGWLTDATVYGTLFLTLSGIYLWLLLRTERKLGLIMLGAGLVSFALILYALMFA